jgi:hypothetical protein
VQVSFLYSLSLSREEEEEEEERRGKYLGEKGGK